MAAIIAAASANSIECIPGSFRAKISCTRVTRLTYNIASMPTFLGRPDSLKHAAIVAQGKVASGLKVLEKFIIELGYAVPFTAVPKEIVEGFEKRDAMFKSGDQTVRSHYQHAINILHLSLGEPLIDLLLIIALTLMMASELPTIAPRESELKPSDKQGRHHGAWAACLITKMLWFLKPEEFGWDKDKGEVLCVKEMNKKIGEHAIS